MRSSSGRAVVATALPGEAESLRVMLGDSGCSEVVCVADGLSAVAQIRQRRTDWLVADAVLPVLDGASLAVEVASLPLSVYPGVLLLTVPGMCPKTGAAVLKKPVTRERLAEALEALRPERRAVPGKKRERARQALDSIGIPDHCGRDYLLRAIEIAWLDERLLKALTTRLYPSVAEEFGADARHVERAIRHVIDVAWRSGEMEAQYKIFGDTIDAKRGSPTCGEMIAQIADILRWEGKA